MKDQDKEYLREAFDALSDVEQRRLLKRASKRKKRAARDLDAGRAAYKIPRNKRRAGRRSKTVEKTVEDWAIEILAEEMVAEDLPVYEGDGDRGTVVSTYPAWCDVRLHSSGETILCHLVGELARTQKTSLAVGDEVVVYPADDERGIVTSVLPRRTILSRPDPHNENLERVLVANVDVVCVVVSVKEPALHPRVIDRFWLAVQRGGASPFVVVNKIDLLDEGELEGVNLMLEPYREAGMRFFFVSAETSDGLDELSTALGGKVCTFIGHSGVGKSSILNQLFPEVAAATGEVRESDGRGKHTTTRATMYEGAGGTTLIDTPGVRSFGLWAMKPDEVGAYFEEFETYARDCRFPDCTHVHEPGCAVQVAVEAGEISAFRYETYVRLIEDEF